MAYYNVREYSKAMELLLNSLVNTSKDKDILRYRGAIRFYKVPHARGVFKPEL